MESIGGPLMAAVTAIQAERPDVATAGAASTMAELLSRSVQFGIALSASLHLKGSDGEAAAIRMAMTALAASLVGELYRRTGQPPAENDIRRLQPAFDAILSFADQFAPDAETIERMKKLEPGALANDDHQATMQYLQAFVPVVAEISLYSFGRSDRKLVQDVASRLSVRASAMRQSLFPDEAPSGHKILETRLLNVLCALYLECHRTERMRLEGLSEADKSHGGEPSLDGLWALFEERAAMLEMLSSALFDSPLSGNVQPTVPVQQKPTSVAVQPPPEPPPVQYAQYAESVPAEPPPEKPSSPMGFLAGGWPGMIVAARMIAACVFLAANTYEIPPAALMGIYQIESGTLGQEVRNTNGSYDLGPMQINTVWLPDLAQRWGVSTDTARRLVRDDACTNVGVAAWILRQHLDETGNIATAIAHYNSRTPLYGGRYKSKVVQSISRYQLIPLNRQE